MEARVSFGEFAGPSASYITKVEESSAVLESQQHTETVQTISPQKKLTWLQDHKKFFRQFTKEGKRIKREIILKKNFYKTVKGRNTIPISQRNQLINHLVHTTRTCLSYSCFDVNLVAGVVT